MLADSLLASISGILADGCPAMPSFTYRGEPFSPQAWNSTIEKNGGLNDNEDTDATEDDTANADAPPDKYLVTYTSPDKLLQLSMLFTVYNDFPVVECHPKLSAIGTTNTGIVDSFRSVALTLPLTATAPPNQYPLAKVHVRACLGSKNRQDDFVEQNITLTNRFPLSHLTLDTDEGCSSAAWLPFFAVDLDEQYGFNVAVGWSGEWNAIFNLEADRLCLDIGMKRTHFRLHRGESILQPSFFVMLRDGMSVRECQNLHRQFMLRYHSPHDSAGNLIKPPFAVSVWGGQPNAIVLDYLDKIRKRGIKYDVLWMDAGWYGVNRPVSDTEYKNSDWSATVGNWRVNQVPHPGGLKPISDSAHKLGLNFMLWVEMERVAADAPVAKEHPDWILRIPDSNRCLLNLGMPEVREWAVATVKRLVEEEGVDYYREDFNFNSIPYWNKADASDRQGVTEANFITGFYEFWDTIRKMYPNMLIDNCASGGRRVDFETCSRSICLWRSDLIGRPWFDSAHSQQTQLSYLAQWVPLFGGACAVKDGCGYELYSAASPAYAFGCGYSPYNQDTEWERAAVANLQKLQSLFLGDFYPLTEHPEDGSRICAYQLHEPETGAGAVLTFRFPETVEDTVTLRLNAVEPRAKYKLEVVEGSACVKTGTELSSFTLHLPSPRSYYVAFYSRVRPPRKKTVISTGTQE